MKTILLGDILTAEGLNQEDKDRLHRLIQVWERTHGRNRLRRDFYSMHVNVENIGIALSEEMLGKVQSACSWAGKAVDMLAQRSVLDGFVFESGEDDGSLQRILRDNNFDLKYPMAAKSELIHSLANFTLSRGKVGRSNVRIKTHSAESSVVIWDGGKERVECGMAVIESKPIYPSETACQPTIINLYTDDHTVVLERDPHPHQYHWRARYENNPMGRPLIEPMCYEPSLDRPFGKSRIDRNVMSLCMSNLREQIRAEVSAEFFTTPQKWLLGVSEEAFDMNRYQAYIGNMMLVTKDEDGETPEVLQLAQGTMQPHIDYMRSLASQFAAATAIPLHALGVVTDNPDSAEAMQMAERDLVQLAEKMNRTNGAALRNVALMAMAIDKGIGTTIDDLSEDEYSVIAKWSNPSMPNLSAVADAWVKIASTPGAEYIGQTEEYLEGFGIDKPTRIRMLNQKRRITGRSFMENANANTEDGATGLFDSSWDASGNGTRVRVTGVGGSAEEEGSDGSIVA